METFEIILIVGLCTHLVKLCKFLNVILLEEDELSSQNKKKKKKYIYIILQNQSKNKI